MKKCPFCAEEIQDEAVKCRFCGSNVDRAAAARGEAGSAAGLVSGAAKPGAAVDPGERRVLYSGSPSWRAYFGSYAIVVIAAIAVPLLSAWIARSAGATQLHLALAIAIPLALGAIAFAALHFYRRSRIFRVTTTNIESEYGLLSKRIDVLELWRCRDVRYAQSLTDRILRIAHIEIHTADVTTPLLRIVGVPASRQLFERIRDSIEIQRQSRNVVGMVQ